MPIRDDEPEPIEVINDCDGWPTIVAAVALALILAVVGMVLSFKLPPEKLDPIPDPNNGWEIVPARPGVQQKEKDQ